MEGPQPSVTIPASPEMVLNSVSKQMTARILVCAKGGFIVVFDGHGIAARSNWTEVVEAITDAGCEHLGVDRPEALPNIIEQDERPKANFRDILHSFAGSLSMVSAMLVAVLSVKLA